MKHLIAPSVLASDFANIQQEVEMVNNSLADWFHIDIMDGRFVPNISFGFPVLKAIKKHARKPLDVHLMIVEPDQYLETFKEAGADILTVHLEACKHLHRSIGAIKEMGIQAGVALNPHTPVSSLECIIAEVDLVCLMSVNPGFGGQHFIDHTLVKIRQLKKLIRQSGSKALIEIDGGVKQSNARSILAAGADVLVAGSSVFKADDPKQAVRALKGISLSEIIV